MRLVYINNPTNSSSWQSNLSNYKKKKKKVLEFFFFFFKDLWEDFRLALNQVLFFLEMALSLNSQRFTQSYIGERRLSPIPYKPLA